MKKSIYLYAHSPLSNLVIDILFSFEVNILTNDIFKDKNFKNNNVLFVNKKYEQTINQSFFSNNNVIFFLSKQEKESNEKINSQAKYFYGPLNTKQFIENIRSYFFSALFYYKDIKILDEEMINIKNGSNCLLTGLEKKILTEFIEHKKISRNYFLEKIFKINKDAETKTIESHLTRIRKKLNKINSEIQISLKENIFYLED